VGKTELSRTIAREVFLDPKALIQLDMSEFAEHFSLSKLIGSPAGYVGYRDRNQLTDAVKERPHSLVLFDELEKAHPDVLHLLLQILEEGALSDSAGRRVDFRQTMVVMTTNIGAEQFERGHFGFTDGGKAHERDREKQLRKNLEDHFRPEFVNRIDTIAIFQPLEPETLFAIAEKMLKELTERLEKDHLLVRFTPAVPKCLGRAANAKHGARDLRHLVQTRVETPIAERLLREPTRPQALLVKTQKNTIVVDSLSPYA
jgi:ATP-dependent Clp protease ATP-binding subunit ClpC